MRRGFLGRLSIVVVACFGAVGAGAQEPGPTAVPELTPFQAGRTGRLLTDRLACLGCHRLGGSGGEIGPPLDGLAERLPPERVVAMILDPQGTLPGTRMPRQPMPEREARRLAAYILATGLDEPAPATSTPAPVPPAGDASGEALYIRHCAACHGAEGRGDGWNAPNLPFPPTAHADGALMQARPDDALYDAIHAGGYVLDRSARMPAFGELLTPEDIRALVAHIRVLCDCEAPAWSRRGGAP